MVRRYHAETVYLRLNAVTGRAAPGLVAGFVLGLLALGPGLRRGFLLSYDMVFVPRQPFTPVMFGLGGGPPRAVPSDFAVAVAARVLPADLVQKLVLLLIFVLACSGAAALLDREPVLARLAAGVFYAWNPFVAERLILGQWALLLGYSGLPWVLRAVFRSAQAPRLSRLAMIPMAMLPAIVGGFAAMAVTALVAVPGALLARNARIATVALASLALGSLPWLVPSALHTVYADPAGVTAFAARADTRFGTVGSLLMLGGAWNAQTVPVSYGGAWSVIWLVVVVIAMAGYAVLGRRRFPRAQWLAPTVAALAGLAIAGIGVTAVGRALLRAAIGVWPGFAILRDGQQFIAPLALAEAVGFGLTVAWSMHPGSFGVKKRARPAAVPHRAAAPWDAPGLALGIIALLAPVLLLPGLAWGAAGRLRPVSYPSGWLAAARLIDASRAPGDVLLLPWATYRTLPWNHGEVMLDPWSRLVSRPVIWNDGTRVGDLAMAPDDPRARRLDGVIGSGGPLTAGLRAAGVRFVVVDAGPSMQARLPGSVAVYHHPDLAVYEIPDNETG